ncbi:HTH-type transcriptional regulator / antitoxin HigA [Candidatus Magnetomoraceae bacterium gMMP-15]
MEAYNLEKISNQWKVLGPILSVPNTETEYDNLVEFLDHLLDDIGNDEQHPLASLVDTIGTLIEAYDKEHYPFSEGNPIEVLKYFIQEYNLTQKDLSELGSHREVSEIISGKRSLNTHQIKTLSERFNVSLSTFC